ncbi:hypothetical protein GCM10022402_32310 [Salinactinospora qingdaonensis]|uniref:Uncharacterized protein n=1 Tax=Salinactinospora qingdaonensis TaxID=702744 RepID=A0ABP7FYW5_9ACTN
MSASAGAFAGRRDRAAIEARADEAHPQPPPQPSEQQNLAEVRAGKAGRSATGRPYQPVTRSISAPTTGARVAE